MVQKYLVKFPYEKGHCTFRAISTLIFTLENDENLNSSGWLRASKFLASKT
jgi:hypothetical protein